MRVILALQYWLLLQSESASGKCAKLHTVAASNNRASRNRVHMPWSLFYCLFAPHIYIVVLRAHPVLGESHIKRNATGEVATLPWSPKFLWRFNVVKISFFYTVLSLILSLSFILQVGIENWDFKKLQMHSKVKDSQWARKLKNYKCASRFVTRAQSGPRQLYSIPSCFLYICLSV